MAAYLMANVEILNPDEYQEYVRRNTAIVQRYGGRFAARGATCQVLEGDWNPHRVVLIEFPSGDAVRAWYNSPEYQEILPIRQRNAHTYQIVIVEGA